MSKLLPWSFENWAWNRVVVSALNTIGDVGVPQGAKKKTQIMLHFSVHILPFCNGKQMGWQCDLCASLQICFKPGSPGLCSKPSPPFLPVTRLAVGIEAGWSCLSSMLLATVLVGCSQANKGYSCSQMQNGAFPSGPGI